MKLNFLIIGTQRGGTTSLHHLLSVHPQIKMPVIKELHFFDQHYYKGLNWYQEHFETDAGSLDLLQGEATPSYLYHPLVPERVAKHFPDVKLIVMLRDPVIRAFSQFLMIRKRGREPESDFMEALKLEADRLRNLRPMEDEQSLPSDFSGFYQLSYQKRGLYGEQMQRWLQYFRLDQFHFIKSEEFFDSPERILQPLYAFLGISAIIPPQIPKLNSHTDIKLNADNIEHLYEIFHSDGILLRKLIGDKFRWDP